MVYNEIGRYKNKRIVKDLEGDSCPSYGDDLVSFFRLCRSIFLEAVKRGLEELSCDQL